MEIIDKNMAVDIWRFLTFVVPFYILVSLFEGLFLNKNFCWREAGCSITIKAWVVASSIFIYGWHIHFLLYIWQFRFFDLELYSDGPLGAVLAGLGLLLAMEFCYYWYHRCSHHIRWFWASHIVHHSTTKVNLSAGIRNSWLGPQTGTTMFYLPIVLLGVHPSIVFALLGINFAYQFWIHNSWMPKLGPLEYILNTPSLHRVHHARNQEYRNSNFGGILIIFDLLFKTYKTEKEGLPCEYGLNVQMKNQNPIYVEFREWLALSKDLAGSKNVPNFFRTLCRTRDITEEMVGIKESRNV